jgi:molybdopterin molybdotransferase
MLTVEEALKAVLDRARPLPPRRVPLAEANFHVLAEDVAADIDSPPFDKALVDGYAVRFADLSGGPPYRLRIGEEIPAGRTPSRALSVGEAAVIMTGAPLPLGADSVVMVEHTRREGDDVLIAPPSSIRPGQNRMERGREMRAGEVVLERGRCLTGIELGLLASVGCAFPLVTPRILVRIVPTGDELVEPDQVPGPGQIRNSNAVMLAGLINPDLDGLSAKPEICPIAPDDPDKLRSALKYGLEADVLLITGGVSAGKRDLVPGVLADLGVETVFHKVRLKPGKPLLFGVGPARSEGRSGALVFGLPGNPVSSAVGFKLFVNPAIDMIRGGGSRESWGLPFPTYRLARPFSHRGDRPTCHPAEVDHTETEGLRWTVTPLDWAGSPDLRTVASASGFIFFPAGDRDYAEGEEVEFFYLS